jgi:hypothetical protein
MCSFFWAEIQSKYVFERSTIRDIRDTLDKLPKTAEHIMHQALHTLQRQATDLSALARISLIWLAALRKPSLSEAFARP